MTTNNDVWWDEEEEMNLQPETTFTDHNLCVAELPRLGGQNGKILERLEQGPATNIQLAEYSGSTRVNSRVADVRRYLRLTRQQTIDCVSVNQSAGIHRYKIVADKARTEIIKTCPHCGEEL